MQNLIIIIRSLAQNQRVSLLQMDAFISVPLSLKNHFNPLTLNGYAWALY